MKSSIPGKDWRDPHTGMTLAEMEASQRAKRDAMLHPIFNNKPVKITYRAVFSTDVSSVNRLTVMVDGYRTPVNVSAHHADDTLDIEVEDTPEMRKGMEHYFNEQHRYNGMVKSWAVLVGGATAPQPLKTPYSIDFF